MIHTLAAWLLAAGFLVAGAMNAHSSPATQASYVRWGYPPWWSRVTGAAEFAVAFLIAFPGTRPAGLIIGALIILAAVATVIRKRDFGHLAPLGLFTTLLVLAAASS
jgi:DoxX-like family